MAEINELLSTPDNIETIRDTVAAILAIELEHQHELAVEAGDVNARDYDVGVYVENDDPIQQVNADSNPFPLVNVSIDATDSDKGSTTVNKHNMTTKIMLDVYATGNTSSSEDAGTKASLKAWKTARLVRNIIGAEPYTYLSLQGVVTGRDMTSFQAGEPANSTSAIRVKMIRITLEVTYIEDVAITGGVLFELGGTLTISDKDGHVFVG